MKTLAFAAATLGMACTTAAPAFANETEKMTIKVDVSDLNLASASGQKWLDRRVERAVRTVCRITDPQTGNRILNRDARECLAKARASAKSQVAALIADRQRGG
jgi:UrcA family protein